VTDVSDRPSSACAERACARTELLHEQYARVIHGYCARRLGSREDAEDAVQLVFLIAYRRLADGVEPRFEQAWLFRIAQSVVYGRRRALSRRARIEAPVGLDLIAEYTAAPARETPPELFNLPSALASMSDSQRRALLLREWRGLSYNEVAAELGVSTPTVENLLTRARRNLAERLDGSGRSVRGRLGSVLWLPPASWKWAIAAGGVSKTLAGAASVVVVAVAVQHSSTLSGLLPSRTPAQATPSRHTSRAAGAAPAAASAPAPSYHLATPAHPAAKARPKHHTPRPAGHAGGYVPVPLDPSPGAMGDDQPAADATGAPPAPPSQPTDQQPQSAGSSSADSNPAGDVGAPGDSSSAGGPTHDPQKPATPPGQVKQDSCTPSHDLPPQAQGSPGCPAHSPPA
jgi:RNA polymerase sigma-70 factor (ECF subfamily)